MELNVNLVKSLNEDADRLLGLIEETDEQPQRPRSTAGSIGSQIIPDFSDYRIDEPTIIMDTLGDKVTAKNECYNNKCIGFSGENYILFERLIEKTLKVAEIRNQIGKEFIETNSFGWFTKTHKSSKVEDFSTYLLEKINGAIHTHTFHFPLRNLEIYAPLNIGIIAIHYFRKEHFDFFIQKYKEKFPDSDVNVYADLQKKYQGKVIASVVVRAEKEKAKEVALVHCSLAVDILRTFYSATEFPWKHVSFDIDRRTREIEMSEILYNSESEIELLKIDYERIANFHIIDEQRWVSMHQSGLPFVHNFLLEYTKNGNHSELQDLIINSIKLYSNAVSIKNVSQRVVALFTILESLLLKSETAPIIDSVCKYAPNLVLQEVEQRKDLIQLLKKLYGVRSAMIHHANEKEVDSEEMRKFQLSVMVLIISFIEKSKTHKTKASILDDIDDTLLGAYKL